MDRKNGIDLFRLIGAFFIMCLHTSYGSLNQEYVDNLRLISRWAVPFYFLTSGFFLGKKIENNNLDFKRIQNNVITLISILIVSSAIYLPIVLMKGHMPNSVSNVLTGSFFHLWFIGALLFGYIFIWYLIHTKKGKFFPHLSIGILLLAIFTDSYDLLLNKSIGFDLFRFLLVIPFMYIGIVLSKKDTSLISNKLLIGLTLIGFSIQFIEAELFSQLFDNNNFTPQFLIGTTIIGIPLFILSANINLKENIFSKLGRQYALFIYLYHPMMFSILWLVLRTTIPNYYQSIQIFSPLLGFILMLAFSVILHRYFPKIYSFMNGNLQVKTSDNRITRSANK